MKCDTNNNNFYWNFLHCKLVNISLEIERNMSVVSATALRIYFVLNTKQNYNNLRISLSAEYLTMNKSILRRRTSN